MTGRRLSMALVTGVAALAGMTACGSDKSSSSSGQATTTAAAAATTAAPAATASKIDPASNQLGAAYIGGKPGKADASLSPVTIGYVNERGGTPSFPEHEAAADAAVSWINDDLGGIGGHPLKLHKCIVSVEEDGQKCGAELANASLPLVNQSLLVVGSDSFHKTLGTKTPVIISVPSSPADLSTKNRYTFNGAGQAIFAGMVADAKKRGIKRVAIANTGNPAGKYAITNILVPLLDKAGIAHGKPVYYPDDATTPDIVSALDAAGIASSDATMFGPSGPGQCVSTYDGLRQLNLTAKVQVITTLLCNADQFIQHTGGGPEGWSIWSFSTNQRVQSDPQVKAFNAVMNAYGAGKYRNVGLVVPVFSDILTIAKLANAIGPDSLSATAFETQIKQFRGPVWMVPGVPRCDAPRDKNTPTLCGNAGVGSTFKDGHWEDLGVNVNTTLQAAN